jgi:hypothetical protein
LAVQHPLRTSSEDRCTCIEYSVLLTQPILGKRKRGAPFVESTTVLCYIDTEQGKRYRVDCCVRGHLVELCTNFDVHVHATRASYLAIIKPKLTEITQCVQHLTLNQI